MHLLNKKAEEASSGGLGDLVHIIVVVLLVGFLIFLTVKIIGALLGTGDRESLSNFNAMADNIEIMTQKPSSFAYTSMIFFLEKKYYVYAFSSREYGSGAIGNRYPEKCDNQACICLYNDINDFYFEPVACRKFEKSIAFHGFLMAGADFTQNPLNDVNFEDDEGVNRLANVFPEDYEDYPEELDIKKYGHFLLGYLPFDPEHGGINTIFVSEQYYKFFSDIYLEKLVVDGRIHVLAAGGLSKDAIEKRASMLSNCPSGSDEECANARWNSEVDDGFCYYDESARVCLYRDEDVDDCPYDRRITSDCMCGAQFVQASEEMYCFETSDDRTLALPFNCKDDELEDKECAGYCTAITEGTDGCDPSERYYCTTDPCGFGSARRPCSLQTILGKVQCLS